jgi:hypothetical protein
MMFENTKQGLIEFGLMDKKLIEALPGLLSRLSLPSQLKIACTDFSNTYCLPFPDDLIISI